YAFLQAGRDCLLKTRIHVERHQVEADIRLPQTHLAEPHRMPLVLRKRRRHPAHDGINRRRVSPHIQPPGVRAQQPLQRLKTSLKTPPNPANFTPPAALSLTTYHCLL